MHRKKIISLFLLCIGKWAKALRYSCSPNPCFANIMLHLCGAWAGNKPSPIMKCCQSCCQLGRYKKLFQIEPLWQCTGKSFSMHGYLYSPAPYNWYAVRQVKLILVKKVGIDVILMGYEFHCCTVGMVLQAKKKSTVPSSDCERTPIMNASVRRD